MIPIHSQTNIKNYNNTISGNGAPGLNIPCGIPNPGQIYDDQATGFLYGCSDGTWKFGGVTFPVNAIVFGVTPTSARAAVPADIRNMGTTQAFILPAFTTVSIPSDADYTLNAVQSVQKTIVLNSASPLTATRNVIAPLVPGQEYDVENATSGGQNITLIGPSGTGVTIANGKSASVFSDGVNYIGSSGGGSSAGGIGVQYSTDGITLQAANVTGPLYGNGANAPTLETTNQANTALGFSNGQFISGDSIACSTGTTSTGPGNFFLQNGFASRLQPLVGGPYQDACQPGDQTADGNYKWVFRATNPQGEGIDPLCVSELGTNDAIFYMGNADKQLIFQRLQLANLSHMAIPVANVQLAQGCTLSGFTADTASGGHRSDIKSLQWNAGCVRDEWLDWLRATSPPQRRMTRCTSTTSSKMQWWNVHCVCRRSSSERSVQRDNDLAQRRRQRRVDPHTERHQCRCGSG